MTITRPGTTDVQQRTVSLTIDGRSLTVAEGTTIWQAARDVGIDIPTLCHDGRAGTGDGHIVCSVPAAVCARLWASGRPSGSRPRSA